MSNLIKVAASIVALVGMSIPAHSQQFQLESAVVDTCTAVALAEINDENRSTLRGQCLDATRSYLVNVSNRGLSDENYDQTISDLVVVLADILFKPNCIVESEVAQAIAMANASSNDPDQQAQIQLIYQTVNACDFVVTAAIFSPNPNSLIDGSGSSGTPASQN